MKPQVMEFWPWSLRRIATCSRTLENAETPAEISATGRKLILWKSLGSSYGNPWDHLRLMFQGWRFWMVLIQRKGEKPWETPHPQQQLSPPARTGMVVLFKEHFKFWLHKKSIKDQQHHPPKKMLHLELSQPWWGHFSVLSLCQDAPLLPGAPIALLGAGPASSGLPGLVGWGSHGLTHNWLVPFFCVIFGVQRGWWSLDLF